MSVTVLSPHRDDAAFSCGLLILALARAGCTVQIVNVCTISDYAPYAEIGLKDDRVAAVTRIRAQEDESFARVVATESRHAAVPRFVDIGWKDAPLRRGIVTEDVLSCEIDPREVESLATALRQLSETDVVLAPLSLGGHIDHRETRIAAEAVWAKDSLLFYEDLPYACRLPESVRAAYTADLLAPNFVHFASPKAASGQKRRLALCYRSQIAEEVAEEMETYAAKSGWTESFYRTEAAGRSFEECGLAGIRSMEIVR